MHIVTVEKFLWCFKLETGGYVIGYIGALLSALAIAVVASIGVLAFVSFDNIDEFIADQDLNMKGGDLLNKLLDSQIRESKIVLKI